LWNTREDSWDRGAGGIYAFRCIVDEFVGITRPPGRVMPIEIV
jgi:hypothetical protein